MGKWMVKEGSRRWQFDDEQGGGREWRRRKGCGGHRSREFMEVNIGIHKYLIRSIQSVFRSIRSSFHFSIFSFSDMGFFLDFPGYKIRNIRYKSRYPGYSMVRSET